MSLSKIFSYSFNLSRGSIIASHNSNTIGSIFTTGGNIGINTTNPLTLLHINGSSLISGDVTIGSNLIVTGPTLQIPTGNIASRPGVPQNGSIRYNTETQQFEGYGPGGAWGSLGGVIDIAQTTRILASATPSTTDGNLYFFTTGTERMRINSSGNIGIGTTAPSFLLDVNGNSRFINSIVTNSTITNLTLVNSSISSLSLSNAIDLSNVTQFSGSFSAANNVNVATDVTGFQLSNSVYGCFTSTLNVRITTSTGQLNSQVYMEATQNTSGWLLNDSTLGDSTGITFTLNSSGQLQYTSTNQPNWISTTFTYLVNGIKLSSGLTQSIQTSGNAIISGNLTILNTTDIGGSSTPSLAIAGGLSVDKRSFFNNNVGIGTTNPTFNLDVIGIARITDSITTGGLEITGLTDTLNLTATNSTLTNLISTNITSSNISSTTFSGSNLNLSGNLNVAGTLTVVNITSTNLVDTNLTAGVARITNNFAAVGNSNTLGNIFTTGGNIGIGTISPSTRLAIVGSTTGVLKVCSITNSANDTWWIGFGHNGDSSDATDRARVGINISSGGAGRLFFTTGLGGAQVERLRIDESGNVGIGTDSPQRKLDVTGRIMLSDGALDSTDYGALQIVQNDSAINTRAHIALIRSTQQIAYIRLNTSNQLVLSAGGGGVFLASGGTSWSAVSDRNLKTNFQDIPNPLDKVMNIKGTYYKFKTDSQEQKRRVGVIAQDVQSVLPEIVSEDKDGILGVSYTDLVPLLIEAIKEQQTKINKLETFIRNKYPNEFN